MFDFRKIFDLRKIFAVPKDFLKSKIYCSTFEFDFKLVSNGYFWSDLRYLKTQKGQTCLPL